MNEPFEDTGALPVVAEDNKPCDTCGKVHTPDTPSHVEDVS